MQFCHVCVDRRKHDRVLGGGMLIFHVLLTYGRKLSGTSFELRDRAEAKPQLEVLDDLRSAHPEHEVKIVADYSREVTCLGDLEKLVGILSKLKNAGQGLVFVDDLHRIFRRTPQPARSELLSQMRSYGEHLLSIRHGKKLSDFSEREVRGLLCAEHVKPRAIPREGNDTTRATSASAALRSNGMRENARKLTIVKDDLERTHARATFQMIADKANESGLRTTRGLEWTRQSVQRTLAASAVDSSK